MAQLNATELQLLLSGPAGKPPPGVLPNFVNPPTLNTASVSAMTVELVLTTLFVSMRMYTKAFLMRSLWYEDCMIIGAWCMQVGFLVVSVLTMNHHGGTHMWDVRLAEFFQLLYWVNVSAIVYSITVLFIKISILLQYLRIFVPSRKDNMALFVAIQITAWSIVAFYVLVAIFELAMCNPRSKIWHPLMTNGHCFNENATYIAIGIFNVVSDFVLLILPLIPIWKLQMPPKKKLLIMLIFATGFLGCMTSILRTYYTFQIARSRDTSYNIVILGLWTWAETTIGLLVACLPVLPRFFQHFGPKVYGALSIRSKFSQNSATSGSNKGSLPRLAQRSDDDDGQHGRAGKVQSWIGTHSSLSRGRDQYLTLNKSDVSKTGGVNEYEIPQMFSEGFNTRRADLETGV